MTSPSFADGDGDIAAIADRLATAGGAETGNGEPGFVVWITGLSGAGKSTVSRELAGRLECSGIPALLLDGDELRKVFGAGAHGREDRHRLAVRYGRLCGELAGRGVPVICATISMFHDVQRWNRSNIEGYVEVFLRVPLTELQRRDPKGIYRRAAAGELQEVVGLDLAAEEPETPDLLVDHADGKSPGEVADAIVLLLERKGLTGRRRWPALSGNEGE